MIVVIEKELAKTYKTMTSNVIISSLAAMNVYIKNTILRLLLQNRKDLALLTYRLA